MNNYTTSERKLATETDRKDYDQLLAELPKVPNLRTAVFEFIQTIHNQRTADIIEVRHDGKLVGAALFYTKNKNKDTSTTSLYSIFSISPGAGKMAFNAYWNHCVENSRWYKFYVNKHAHLFYARMGFRYWGVSKGGDNFFTFGRVYGSDPIASNNQWMVEYEKLTYNDESYFIDNMKIVNEKTISGLPKLKNQHLANFQSCRLVYEIDPPFEII